MPVSTQRRRAELVERLDLLHDRRKSVVDVHRRLAGTVDVFATLGYEPNCAVRHAALLDGRDVPPCGRCPQELFHAAAEWDVLYGGASSGGKTKALLMEAMRACVRYPGLVVLAIRESYPELRESLLFELGKVNYRQLGAVYAKSEKDLTFGSGSVIRFRHCDSLEDAKLRLGSEIQLLIVDEATMQQPAAIDFLCSRLRSSDPAIPVLGVRLGSNPGGPGHGYCKARYIDATNAGQDIYEDVNDEGESTGHMIRFIPARHTDNPHVHDYEQTLTAIKDPQMRAAYRDGSWDVFPGQVFTEWRRHLHVCKPFEIPAGWRREAGVDYGYAAPWCVLWGALDQDGRCWVYREAYRAGVGEREQAEEIRRLEGGEEVRRRHGDPSMWNKLSDAHPVAVSYQMAGVALEKAENGRVIGWGRVHTYLALGPACSQHRQQGLAECPLLHVFPQCSNLIRTLPTLPSDPHDAEDVDTAAEDHAADALRYLLMGLPIPRVQRPVPRERTVEDKIWAQLASRRKVLHPELGRF